MHLAVFPLTSVGFPIELLEFAEPSNFVILKVARVDTTISKSETANAVFPPIFEEAFVFRAIALFFDALALPLIINKSTNKFCAIALFVRAATMDFALHEGALIDVAIFHVHNALAVDLVPLPLTFILAAIRPLDPPPAIFHAIQQLALVHWAVSEDYGLGNFPALVAGVDLAGEGGALVGEEGSLKKRQSAIKVHGLLDEWLVVGLRVIGLDDGADVTYLFDAAV